MTAITLGDLPREEHLDREAMLAIRGGTTKQSAASALSSDSYNAGDPYQAPVPDSDSGLKPFIQPYTVRWNEPIHYRHYKAGDSYSSAIPTRPGFLTA